MDLERFKEAHGYDYSQALKEIRNGFKETHWMWYIFPQIDGLGSSYTAKYYALKDLDDARAFLEDDYLGGHLIEITQALLDLDKDNPNSIFGYVDAMKLRSSMTLFYEASHQKIFKDVIEKYYQGEFDSRTLEILGK